MTSNESIAPAFSSDRQAVGFVLLLILSLASPALLSLAGVPHRNQIYSSVPTRPVGPGAFGFIHRQIFEEKSDIDMLFLGSSVFWQGINTALVQAELSKRLKRPATALNFGSSWRGEDMLYMLFRDLLDHRKIKMLVMSFPILGDATDEPHAFSRYWLPWDLPELKGLSRFHRKRIYALNVLGAPRKLVSLLRPNLAAEDTDFERNRGALLRTIGISRTPFKPKQTQTKRFSSREVLYSPETKDRFEFSGQALTHYQGHFLNRLMELAKAKGIPVVELYVPTYSGRRTRVCYEKLPWSKFFGRDVPTLGIPGDALFHDMPDEEVGDYFVDITHMNLNGASLYTQAFLPALMDIYEKTH